MANISQINGNLINAATASLAVTASFALAVAGGGGGASFPYTGSAIISGSLTVIGGTNINGALSATSITSSGNSFLNGNVLLKGTLTNNQGLTIQDRNGATVVSLPTEANGIMYSGSTYSLNIGGGGSAAKVTIQGNGATNSTLNTLFRDSNLTTRLSIYDGGNVGIGNITPLFPLDVAGAARFQSGITGSLVITGSLTSTDTISSAVINFTSSSLTGSRILLDNTFDNLNINGLTPNVRTRSSLLRVYGTYTTGSANTANTNHILAVHIYPTFAPTNNSTSTFNTLTLEPQFLNTSATGSARGLLVTPGFAGSHPNFRSIEWDNVEGYGLYGVGSARNYLLGALGIGTLSPSASLHVTGSGIYGGTLAVGTSSLGPNENTITLGARDAVNEGGQIGFNAPGGTYTSASMIDLYQNRLRVLKGTNAGSTAEVAAWNMHNLQMQLPAYSSPTSFTGTEVAILSVDAVGNILTSTVPGSTVFGNYAGTGFTNPIVTYLPFGTTTVSGTEAQRQIASPFAGTIKNLYVRTNNTSAAGSNTTFTLRVNGVSTGVVVTIGSSVAAGKYSDTTNSALVAVGDEISLQVSTSVANGPQVNQYSFGIYSS